MNHCEFVRKSVSFDGLLNGSKSAVSSSFTDKETAREPLQGIEKNPRYHAPLSSAFESSTLIKQNTKPAVPTTQSHTTTRKFLSTMSLKSPLNISAKETKASFPQATRNQVHPR